MTVLVVTATGLETLRLSGARLLRVERLEVSVFPGEGVNMSGRRVIGELVSADEKDDQENGKGNAEQPQETVAGNSARLIGDMLDGFHGIQLVRV